MVMVMSKLSDLSLIDFVGMEENDNKRMPDPTDPVALLAFVCDLSASRLEVAERQLAMEYGEFCRPKRVVNPPCRFYDITYYDNYAANKKESRPKVDAQFPKPKPKPKPTPVTFSSRFIKDQPKASRNAGCNNASDGIQSSSSFLAPQVIKDKPESSCKRKRTSDTKANKKLKTSANTGPEPPPGFPERFKFLMENMGGKEPKLVIQKRLYKTDLAQHNSRLSIPVNAVRNKDFLTMEEMALLDSRDEDNHCIPIRVKFLDPRGKLWKINLRKWDMGKGNNKPVKTKTYNLNKPWRHIVAKNAFAVGDLVQVWAFRIEEELALAMVKLEE